TSSGALNNIWPHRGRIRVHFADLTDRTSVDYLVKELCRAPDRPYVFHLGAQAHVGESWHRPYETVMANTVGTLNLLQSIVDHGPRGRDDRARPARADARLLLLRRRRARPPRGRSAGHPGRPVRVRPGPEQLDARLGGPDPARRPRPRLLARARGRVRAGALPAGSDRRHGAARRLR